MARAAFSFLILSGLWGCLPASRDARWFAMDTEFAAVAHGRGKVPADSAFAALRRESARLETRFSNYRPGSDVNEIQGNKGDTLALDGEMALLFAAAESLTEASRGRFDVTLGPLKRAYGLGSGEKGRVPPRAEISALLAGNRVFRGDTAGNAPFSAFHMLETGGLVLRRDSLEWDFGALAKGYAVDRMSRLLDSLGFTAHLVQAGGDMLCLGRKPSGSWRVGIRHPRFPDSLCGSLSFDGSMAVSTSGDYERFFFDRGARYHHILDPATGGPARPYCSVTVLARGSRVADGLSTTLFVLGPERGRELLRRYGGEALFLRETPDGSLCAIASPGFGAHLISLSPPHCP